MSAGDIAAAVPVLAAMTVLGVIAAIAGCYWVDYACMRDSASRHR